LACWNPVFFVFGSEIFLYFKVGATPERWRGYYSVSHDCGETWDQPIALAAGIFGPTKNPPLLVGSTIISGSSDERAGRSIHFELSSDGRHWRKIQPAGGGDTLGGLQPALLNLEGGRLLAYARTSGGRIARTHSVDAGKTWSPLEPTELPNPDSAIAAITARNGRHVLVYNRSSTQRTPLVLATSTDGETWFDRQLLEADLGEYSYPAVCATLQTLVITYTIDRRALGLLELSSESVFGAGRMPLLDTD
jgi:predicted neuraminidase